MAVCEKGQIVDEFIATTSEDTEEAVYHVPIFSPAKAFKGGLCSYLFLKSQYIIMMIQKPFQDNEISVTESAKLNNSGL